jgi:hypothetical protein
LETDAVAPAAIQASTSLILSSGTGSPMGGIFFTPSPRIALMIRLSSGLPATTAGPSSVPFISPT